jgi:hypothetical protein
MPRQLSVDPAYAVRQIRIVLRINMKVTPETVVLIVCTLAVMFHLGRFGSTNVSTIAIGLLFLASYELYRQNNNRSLKQATQAINLQKLHADLGESADLKYLNIDKRILPHLTAIRFIRRFNRSLYTQYVHTVQACLKKYYKILAGNHHMLTGLDLLYDLHLEYERIHNEVFLSIPRYSSRLYRYGNRSLHDVFREHSEEIGRLLRSKIKRIVNKTKINPK